MATALEALVARLNATAYLPPLTAEEKAASRNPRRRKRKLLKAIRGADSLSRHELAQLVSLVDGRARIVDGYVVRRTALGWSIEALQGGWGEHTVNVELTKCSCPDHRLRGHAECKHLKLLRGIHAS